MLAGGSGLGDNWATLGLQVACLDGPGQSHPGNEAIRGKGDMSPFPEQELSISEGRK